MVSAFRHSTRATVRIVAAGFISLMILLTFAPKVPAQSPVYSNGIIPLRGTIFDANLSSDVQLTGDLHIETWVSFLTPNIQIFIQADLPEADVKAVNSYGERYTASGRSSVTVTTASLSSLATPIVPNFVLFRPIRGPSRVIEIPRPVASRIGFVLKLSIRFTEAGDLIPAESSATAEVAP